MTILPSPLDTFPSWRAINGQGLFLGADVIGFDDEKNIDMMHHPFVPHQSFALDSYRIEPSLRLVMAKGRIVRDSPPLSQTAQYSRERLEMLPAEYKRFENPHVYKVGISSRLKDLKGRAGSLTQGVRSAS